MSSLHVTAVGEGEPVVFVHGSFVAGGATWSAQRPLAERYRLLFVDRRGYGGSEPTAAEDFDRDADDLVELLAAIEGGAHLVGHSYGAVISLLAAGRRPDVVRSLAVIEPPSFQLTPRSPAARAMRGRIAAVFDTRDGRTPEDFFPDFLRALGYDLETLRVNAWSDLRRGVRGDNEGAFRASMHQRMPWDAPIPLRRLKAAAFPKLVISGDWASASEASRAAAGVALNDVCDVLASRIGARRAVISDAVHYPHRSRATAFNACLAEFLDSASSDATSAGSRAADPAGQ